MILLIKVCYYIHSRLESGDFMSYDIIKYPRTRHLEGSKLQQGDEDLSQIPFKNIKGKYIVIEEKIDGANTAISFDDNGNLLLQSRGHYLTGGYRERHYNLFKQWATSHRDEFYNVLGSRYILYGEWMYAKHTLYYDNLPHYFFEFDVYDKTNSKFLSTKKRQELLKGLPIVSVPILATGCFNKIEDVLKYIKQSNYISNNSINNLTETAVKLGLDIEQIKLETDLTNLMEGLYIKVEDDNEVLDRLKYVRYSFLQTITTSTSSWIDKTIIPNRLDKDITELF